MSRLVLFVIVATVAFGPFASRGADPNHFPTFAGLGAYSNLFAGICGKKGVDTAPVAIPKIGCFAVKAGSSITGDVEGRSVRIDADRTSYETFFVEGREIHRMRMGATNDALVKSTGLGYAFCKTQDAGGCPTEIDTLDRKAEEFIIFDVTRKFAPAYYTTNEENWEAEQSKIRVHDQQLVSPVK